MSWSNNNNSTSWCSYKNQQCQYSNDKIELLGQADLELEFQLKLVVAYHLSSTNDEQMYSTALRYRRLKNHFKRGLMC